MVSPPPRSYLTDPLFPYTPLFRSRAAAAAAARVRRRRAEEHQDAAVRRPGRSLFLIRLAEEPLSRPVRPHHADMEAALVHLGEGDQVAARRPDRRGIPAVAMAGPADVAAACVHVVEPLRPAAVGDDQVGRASYRDSGGQYG